MTEVQRTAMTAAASEKEDAVALAEKDTEQPREAYEPVYGPVEDELFGQRIRKSFGSRAFWGTVVDAYVVGKGLFYKVSFDDGDVDILSVNEVKLDLKAALLHAAEDTLVKEPEAEDSYTDLMRAKKASLKRRRDGSLSDAASDPPPNPRSPWHVKLWSTRLFATIMEEKGYIRVQSFVPMADGEKGELESSGTIQPGDALLAVQGRIVHGVMDHIQACDMIRALPRPLTLTFIRPPSTGERLAIGAAVNMIKEFAPPQLQSQRQNQNRSGKTGGESTAKKTRTDEDAVTGQPMVAASSAASNKTGKDGPHQIHSRPSTPEFEIIQVVQPGAPLVAPPQPRLHQPQQPPSQSPSQPQPQPQPQASRYFARSMARGPSVPVAAPHPNSTGGAPVRHVGIRQNPNQQQLGQNPSYPPPAGVVQMAHPQVGQHAYTVLPTYTMQNPMPYNSTQYNPQNQQPPAVYTSTQMAHAPPSSTRPTFYISHQGPTSHFMGGAPGVAYAMNGGYQNAQSTHGGPPMGSAAGHQHPMVGSGSMQPAPSQARTATTSGDPMGQNVGTRQSPFQPQSGVKHTAPRSAFSAAQGSPQQQQQQASQHAVTPQGSASTTQQAPSGAVQDSSVMTLGDLVANLHQRQREQRANAQRVASSMAPSQQSVSVQPATSSIASSGRRSAGPSPDKYHPSSALIKSVSPAPSVEDEGTHSFLRVEASLEDYEGLSSTGTSFLSADDTSLRNDIPATRKPSVVARMRVDATPARRPSYLNKYTRDEVVDVLITQPRLYLTLGAMGDHISISTFVRGPGGQIGEIEASGKVLTGDILVGVGSFEIARDTTPTDVARLVNLQPRPYYAYFMRPTWDMLE